MSNRTFAIIKPDAIKNGFTGKIYDRIISEGYIVIGAKITQMTLLQSQEFYKIHKNKSFYSELTEFMSSGPSMVLVLEKENAVIEWRTIIGNTNPNEANEGTIRKEFATNVEQNAVHGSDSNENAKKEISFFFTESELIINR